MMRMCLEQRLSSNPIDYEAQQQLQEVELKVRRCVIGWRDGDTHAGHVGMSS